MASHPTTEEIEAKKTEMFYHIMSRTPNFRTAPEHRETLIKILSIEQLPTHQEVVDLILYSEVVSDGEPELHERIFGTKKPLMSYASDLHSLNGGFLGLGVYHILTKEFVQYLAAGINQLNLQGPFVEIAAGNGKLSYHLNQHGIKIIPTDITPKHTSVQRMGCSEALSLNPEFVLTSWLEPKDAKGSENDLQKRIVEKETVKAYVELGSVEGNNFAGVDTSGRDSKRMTRRVLHPAQSFSLPIDLFAEYYRDITTKYTSVLPRFRDANENFLMGNHSAFLWLAN